MAITMLWVPVPVTELVWFLLFFKQQVALAVLKMASYRKQPYVTAKKRAQSYPNDFYVDNNILFCKFCDHSVDFRRADTVKDHLKSKKHKFAKDQKCQGGPR